jgi:transcription antitermination factor NusG
MGAERLVQGHGGAMGTGGEQVELPQQMDLFSALFQEGGEWFVLHTKSRQEKVVAEDLENLAVPHFLPLISQVRYYGRRKIKVAMPLFPGYLFVRGTREQVFVVDRAKRLVSIIPVTDQQQLNWELKNLNLALANNVSLDPYPSLKTGTRVEVRSGPLRGLQGVIETRSQPNRLILQVQMLGRAVSLEIEASLLDPMMP